MTFSIVDLNNVPDDVNLFGGKAVVLSKLAKGGLAVPQGFVVSSDYYVHYLNNKLDLKEFSDEINRWLDYIGITRECIVRSSANVESTKGFGSPGIFESCVCHDRASILWSIKQVWDSMTSGLAKSFFQGVLNPERLRMAVILQHIKKGDINLVIQTHDFITDKDRIIVEYCEGKTNSIVDDVQNASLCYIDYDNEIPSEGPAELPLEVIKSDCRLIESIIGGKAEIEAQVKSGVVWYLQARAIE